MSSKARPRPRPEGPSGRWARNVAHKCSVMCSRRLPEPPGCYGNLGTRAIFAATAWLPGDEVVEVLGAFGQLAGETAPAPGLACLTRRVALELASPVLGARVRVSKEVVLDLAAELLSLADAMRADGRYATGFALEGIEARLIAALIATVPQDGICDATDVARPLARVEPRPAVLGEHLSPCSDQPNESAFGQATHARRGASCTGRHPPRQAGRRR